MDDLGLVGVEGGKRVGVPRGDGGIDAGDVRGRGVRAGAALAPRRGAGWRGREAKRRSLSGQLVEAGERLILAADVERLESLYEPIRPEHHDLEHRPLVSAAAQAIGAKVRATSEESIGSEREDVVVAPRHVGSDREQRTPVPEK